MSGSGSHRRRRPRWWRSILGWFGLIAESRVHIAAPDIDIVISGRPDRVRRMLRVVTDVLEREEASAPAPRRMPQKGEREDPATPAHRRVPQKPEPLARVVEPSELDDMDSPYALPGVAGPLPGSSASDGNEPSPAADQGERTYSEADAPASESATPPAWPAVHGEAQPPEGRGAGPFAQHPRVVAPASTESLRQGRLPEATYEIPGRGRNRGDRVAGPRAPSLLLASVTDVDPSPPAADGVFDEPTHQAPSQHPNDPHPELNMEDLQDLEDDMPESDATKIEMHPSREVGVVSAVNPAQEETVQAPARRAPRRPPHKS